MALPIWPAMLPTPKLPVDIEPADATSRTEMEDGAAKVRRTRTLITVDYTGSVEFTPLQMKVFEAWHHHYLKDGAEWFTMPLPCGSGIYAAETRFKKNNYKHSLVEGGNFKITFELETRNRPFITKAALDALIA